MKLVKAWDTGTVERLAVARGASAELSAMSPLCTVSAQRPIGVGFERRQPTDLWRILRAENLQAVAVGISDGWALVSWLT